MPNLIKSVKIRNYRSLADVEVELGPLTILVGPNGSGKSNFLDALHFVADALDTTLSAAIRSRGGIKTVRRHSTGHPTHFSIRIDFEVENAGSPYRGFFEFEVTVERGSNDRYLVKREKCAIQPVWPADSPPNVPFGYETKNGAFVHQPEGISPKIERDRLALTVLSAIEPFHSVYDFLSQMRFYNLRPEWLQELQAPDPGTSLMSDGYNAASVLRELRRKSPEKYRQICELLSAIVPGVEKVESVMIGPKETIRFRQDVGGRSPWVFDAVNMSDGTLQALGVLLAVYQEPTPSLVAIEEPESSIHPAAADVLIDVLKDGSRDCQILVTTHSPDLLDHKSIRDEELRAVAWSQGITTISPISEVSRRAVREHLYTFGDLMRMGRLISDQEARTPYQPPESCLESKESIG